MEKSNPLISFLIVIVIAIAGLGFLFLVFNPNNNTTGTDNSTPSPTATVTVQTSTAITTTPVTTAISTPVTTVAPVVSVTPPADWQEIDNTNQHYKAYRPHWYYRLFPPNMEVLGIDPNPIPTASEYMGAIFIMRLTASNNLGVFKSSLEAGYTETTRMINGRQWTMYVGQIQATLASNAKYVKAGYVNVDGREYLAELQNEASNYGGYEAKFETFITTINFY